MLKDLGRISSLTDITVYYADYVLPQPFHNLINSAAKLETIPYGVEGTFATSELYSMRF